MRDEFVTLREALRAPEPAHCADEISEISGEAPVVDVGTDGATRFEIASEMRRFRAALSDGFEAVRERLLRDIACEVLGRELQLAPVDIGAIARRACAQIGAAACVRVHPLDAAAFADWSCDVEVDAALHRGDVKFCVSEGSIDASLGVRLEGVLEDLACD